MIDQQLLSKHKDKVEQYLRILEMSDELLYNGIVSNSELITGYANNTRHFAKEGNLGALEETLTELRKSIDTMETMLKEAIKRAYENREVSDND